MKNDIENVCAIENQDLIIEVHQDCIINAPGIFSYNLCNVEKMDAINKMADPANCVWLHEFHVFYYFDFVWLTLISFQQL